MNGAQKKCPGESYYPCSIVVILSEYLTHMRLSRNFVFGQSVEIKIGVR